MAGPLQPALHRHSAPPGWAQKPTTQPAAPAVRRPGATVSSGNRAGSSAAARVLLPPGTAAGGRTLSTQLREGVGGSAARQARCRCAGDGPLSVDQEVDERTEEYNRRMQQQMGWDARPFEYHYERGLYYHEVWRGEGGGSLICGTMPRNVQDLDYLHHREGVDVVLNLQENKDFHYWKVDFHSIYWRSVSHGMTIERVPAVDFDPDSLRKVLPAAVQVVAKALDANKKVYVHCTAGLGRAPAVCIAYLYWWCGLDLDEAYQHLTDIRPCGPKKEAVRGATFSLLDHRQPEEFHHLPPHAYASLGSGDRHTIQTKVLALQRT